MKINRRVRINDYPLGGQLLLWATRHWVRAYRRGWMVPACVWQSFAAADLDLAYSELCRLLRIVAFRELDLRAISRPSASALSAVEESFMNNFERFERHGSCAELMTLGKPATPAVGREVLAATETIVNVLGQNGHRIARQGRSERNRPAAAIAPLEHAWHH